MFVVDYYSGDGADDDDEEEEGGDADDDQASPLLLSAVRSLFQLVHLLVPLKTIHRCWWCFFALICFGVFSVSRGRGRGFYRGKSIRPSRLSCIGKILNKPTVC